MPRLKNDQHEAFAQNLVKGMSQVDAYEAAGYKRNESHAARLVANGKVKVRVAELTERAAAKTVITREWLLEKQQQILQDAHNAKEFAPANTAVKQLAQLANEWVERKEIEHSGHLAREPMTLDDWEAKHTEDG